MRMTKSILLITAVLVQTQLLPAKDKPAPVAQQLNELLKLTLFSDTEIWKERPEDVAKRLSLPLEYSSYGTSSYRAFPVVLKIGDIRIFSVRLKATNDKLREANIMFTNYGDVVYPEVRNGKLEIVNDSVRKVRDSRLYLRQLIRQQERQLEDLLTSILGKSKRTHLGEDATRVKVRRWDWNNHAFLLSAPDDFCLRLRITTSETADKHGKKKAYRSSDWKRILPKRARHEANKDVLLAEFPQMLILRKNYQVAANWERIISYYDGNEDMYTVLRLAKEQLDTIANDPNLATQTTTARDLSVSLIAAGQILDNHKRRLLPVKHSLSMRHISSYLDKGNPLIVSAYIHPLIIEAAQKRMAKRPTSAKKLAQWKRELQKKENRADLPHWLKNDDSLQLLTIVGYNDTTDEIAISDVSSKELQLLWFTQDEMKKMTNNAMWSVK